MSVVKRQAFPESFKREAVDRVVTDGLSAGAVVRELGLHDPKSGEAIRCCVDG